MKKIGFGCIFLLISCLNIFQIRSESIEKEDYIGCVKRFYQMLLIKQTVTVEGLSSILLRNMESSIIHPDGIIKNMDSFLKENSVLLDSLKGRAFELTQELDYDQICEIINRARVIDEGELFTVLLEVKFPSNMIYYFEINNDTPKQIIEIWLPTGVSFYDHFLNNERKELLQMPGIINDPDGYTNIRMEPNAKSRINGRIVKGEIFNYVPNSLSDWWLVYKRAHDINEKPLGYIHKSRILPFSAFPKYLQKKVMKDNLSC